MNSQTVDCPCGFQGRPKPDAVGKHGRCPNCQRTLFLGSAHSATLPASPVTATRSSPLHDPTTRTHLLIVAGIAVLFVVYQMWNWFAAPRAVTRTQRHSTSPGHTATAGADSVEPVVEKRTGRSLSLGDSISTAGIPFADLLPPFEPVSPMRSYEHGDLLPLNHAGGASAIRGLVLVPGQPLAFVAFHQVFDVFLVKFDLVNGKPIGPAMKLPRGGDGDLPLLISPDGSWLVQAQAHVERGLGLFDAASGLPIKSEVTANACLALPIWSKNGQGVYWANHQGNISSWPCHGEIPPFTGSQGKSVTRLALSADGKFLLSGDTDGEVRIWDIPNQGRYVTSYREHAGPIRWLETKRYAEGVLVLSISGRKAEPLIVELFDLQSQTRKATARVPGHATSVAVTPDWRRIVTGDDAGNLSIFDLTENRIIERAQPHRGEVGHLAISSDGLFLLSGCTSSPYDRPDATVWLRGLPLPKTATPSTTEESP